MNSKACVKLNDKFTEWFTITAGVRQGDILSPNLFSLYINDLAEEIKQLNCGIALDDIMISILLYADDIVFISPSETGLQNMLNHLNQWCKKWRLVVNLDKSQIVHYRPKNTPLTNHIFLLGQSTLEIVSFYKYLGIHLSEFLDYNVTESVLAESSGRALSSIIGTFKNLGNLGFKSYTTLYDNGVVPVMDYGAEIWGFSANEQGSLIQNRAIRYFLGVHRFAPNAGIQGDMGWLDCTNRRQLNMIRFWNRLTETSQNRLVRKVFDWDHSLCRAGTWAHEISAILQSIEKIECFRNCTPVDLALCREKLYDKMKRKWTDDVNEKPKLRTYVKFKSECGTEPYVQANLSRAERSILAQFRTGILPLHIETGRWSSPRLTPEERVCQICGSGAVEDEAHFAFHCHRYRRERNAFSRKIISEYPFRNLSDDDKLRIIMKQENIKLTAKFLTSIYFIRKDILNPPSV